MKKIRIFEHGSEMILEEYVNQFTAEHPYGVTDIQFSAVHCANNLHYCVMVVYDTLLDDAYDDLMRGYEKLIGKDDEDGQRRE